MNAPQSQRPATDQSVTTQHFILQYDGNQTPNGQQLVQALAQTAESDYAILRDIFGGAEPHTPITVTVDNGCGGQENGTNITHDGDCGRGSSGDFDYLRNSFVAELAELFMYAKNNHWNPADSKGEALSRVLAQFLYPGGQQPSFTVNSWVEGGPANQPPTVPAIVSQGLEDWVTQTDGSDTRNVSVGCGVAFLHYLHYQLGFPLQQIVGTDGQNLEDVYRGLTGSSGGFDPFATLVRQSFPQGQPANLNHLDKTPNSDQFFPLPSNSFTSGFLVQSHYGARGNFELVVPETASGQLAHYARNNDDPSIPWLGPTYITAGPVAADRPVSLIESNYGQPGALEFVAFLGTDLVHFWRGPGPAFSWNGPITIQSNIRLGDQPGAPALIQSRFGQRGNFEVVIPTLDGLAHLWRNNDDPRLPWSDPEHFGAGIGEVDAVCMIQSSYGNPGNLEVIARVGDQLFHFWRDSGPSFTWNGPFPILEDLTGFAGAAQQPNLSLIQSRFGHPGNFELVAPAQRGGIAHVSRNSSDPAMPWSDVTIFGTDLGLVDAVSLIQSNYGDVGNLEVVAQVGDQVVHFWRDSGPAFTWNGPVVIHQGPGTGTSGGGGNGGTGGGPHPRPQ